MAQMRTWIRPRAAIWAATGQLPRRNWGIRARKRSMPLGLRPLMPAPLKNSRPDDRSAPSIVVGLAGGADA